MADRNNKIASEDDTDGSRTTSGPISIELTACGACGRSTPVNRTTCIYCSASLGRHQIRYDLVKPNLSSPEPWESGFSVVVFPHSGQPDVTAAARSIEIEPETLDKLLNVGVPVPACYLRSLEDAHIIATRLTDAGIGCSVVGDDLLSAGSEPTRLRSIEFNEDGMVVEEFNASRRIALPVGGPYLVVSGILVRHRSGTTARRRRGKSLQVDDSHEFSDEAVLDIYPPADVFGYRIRATGFDFSDLGDEMDRVAGRNMAKLAEKLSERLTDAVMVDKYSASLPELNSIWPMETSGRSRGLTRRAFGGVGLEQTAVTDNTLQFTKFSRLQRHVL